MLFVTDLKVTQITARCVSSTVTILIRSGRSLIIFLIIYVPVSPGKCSGPVKIGHRHSIYIPIYNIALLYFHFLVAVLDIEILA